VIVAADWWNPVTWLQNVAGFFHGAYDAGGAVLNVLGGALTILTQFFRFFFDTGHFIADAVNWLTATLFPPELQTWFLGTIGEPGQQWSSVPIYESLYSGMMAPALMIASVAAAGRIIRALVDHRTGSLETILSVLPRFLLAVAVIGVPGTPIGVGYTAIAWSVDASIAVSTAIVGLILHASLLAGFQPGQGWFTHLYGVLAATSGNMVVVVVGGIPLLILVLYAAFLMIVRTVMLGFCVVAAPLCLATAVFDANNRFFHWWLDLFGSVLLTPLVLGIAIALSLTLASHVITAAAVGPLLAVVILSGWFPVASPASDACAGRAGMCRLLPDARATFGDRPCAPSALIE
jgi:type IV secretory pathway VirB6-like protein